MSARAAVRFTWRGQPAVARLDDSGWSVPGHPELARALDLAASPRGRSPAEGNPHVKAAELAADLLGGEAGHPPIAEHPGRVY